MKVPIKVKSMGKTYFVWLDEEDYPKVYKYSWYINKSKRGGLESVHARVDKKWVKLHRYIMGCQNGDRKMIDHIDRNPLNNCKSNLRFISSSGNNRNRTKKVGTSSQFPGVYWYKAYGKWKAEIRTDVKRVFLGYFILEEAAAIAYRDAVLKIDPLINHDIWTKLK